MFIKRRQSVGLKRIQPNNTAAESSKRHAITAPRVVPVATRIGRLSRYAIQQSPSTSYWLLNYLAVAASILVIGEIDYVSGPDVHNIVLHADSERALAPYIWIANFLTQGGAFLTVSMLVAVLSEAAMSNVEQLLQHADTCMYAAKRGGKNKVGLHYVQIDQHHV